MTTDSRGALRDLVASLGGQELKGVRYFDLSTETEDDYWHRAEYLDVIMFGVDLKLTTGTFHVTWDRTFVSYGVTLAERSLFDRLLAGTFWRVDESAPWNQVVGQTIQESKVHWADHPSDVANNPYPLAISLRFENGMVIVIAAAYALDEDGEVKLVPGGDEIAVIWDSPTLAELLPEVVDPRAAS